MCKQTKKTKRPDSCFYTCPIHKSGCSKRHLICFTAFPSLVSLMGASSIEYIPKHDLLRLLTRHHVFMPEVGSTMYLSHLLTMSLWKSMILDPRLRAANRVCRFALRVFEKIISMLSVFASTLAAWFFLHSMEAVRHSLQQVDPSFTYAYTLCGHEFVANEKFDKAFDLLASIPEVSKATMSWCNLDHCSTCSRLCCCRQARFHEQTHTLTESIRSTCHIMSY